MGFARLLWAFLRIVGGGLDANELQISGDAAMLGDRDVEGNVVLLVVVLVVHAVALQGLHHALELLVLFALPLLTKIRRSGTWWVWRLSKRGRAC